MTNGKEESVRDLWEDIQNPQVGYPKFTTCSVAELASYCINALRSMRSLETKLLLIFSSEEHKVATYKLMREIVHRAENKLTVTRANPQEIVLECMGCVNMYRTPLTKKNMDTMTDRSVILFQVDSLRSDAVQSVATDAIPNSSAIFFHLTDAREHQGVLPPAVSRATKTAEGIRTVLKICLGILVCVYVLLLSLRFLMRLAS